jgi:Dolichyl-phosphate-mannose-protein mannosyltransferase
MVSAFLNFWNLGSIGLGGDESVYAAQALLLSGDNDLSRYFVLLSRGTSNFLFHQTIQAIIYAAVGFSELSTRFPSAAFNVATCGLLFFLGKEMYSKWTGLIAALLISINGYSITVGRAALLDSTMTFFFTLSMFMLYKWIKTGAPKWAYVLACTTGVAILAKVPSIIIIPIVIITMFAVRRSGLLNLKLGTTFVLILLAVLVPGIIQIVINFDTFVSFLDESSSRVINVPATFYLEKLVSYSGLYFVAAAFIGIILSSIYRTKADWLSIIWLVIAGAYIQLNPIKGWNYFLPLIPVLAIFAANSIIRLVGLLKPFLIDKKDSRNRRQTALGRLATISAGLVGIFLLLSVSYTEIYHSAYNIVYNRSFVGLKEAAYWIKENGSADAGVMTISHGSAQYVFSLYGRMNAYPFGSFSLHTILPGGGSIVGAPPPDPLIQNGTVDYFVHYVSNADVVGDDPYDSHLRYVYFDEYVGLDGTEIREPRAWIFEVGKRLPKPQLEVEPYGETYNITGKGFMIGSYVNIYYGRELQKQIPTDSAGSFNDFIKPPDDSVCGNELSVELTVFDYRENIERMILQC